VVNKKIQEKIKKFNEDQIDLQNQSSELAIEIQKIEKLIEEQMVVAETDKAALDKILSEYKVKMEDFAKDEKKVSEDHMKKVTEIHKLKIEKIRIMSIYKAYVSYFLKYDEYFNSYFELYSFYNSLQSLFGDLTDVLQNKLKLDYSLDNDSKYFSLMCEYFNNKGLGLEIKEYKDKDNFKLIITHITDAETVKKIESEPFNLFDEYPPCKLINISKKNNEDLLFKEKRKIVNKIESFTEQFETENNLAIKKVKELLNSDIDLKKDEEQLKKLEKSKKDIEKSSADSKVEAIEAEIEESKEELEKLKNIKIPPREEKDKHVKEQNQFEKEMDSIDANTELSFQQRQEAKNKIKELQFKEEEAYEKRIDEKKAKLKGEIEELKNKIKDFQKSIKEVDSNFEKEKDRKISELELKIDQKINELDEKKKKLIKEKDEAIVKLNLEIQQRKEKIYKFQEKADVFNFLTSFIQEFFTRLFMASLFIRSSVNTLKKEVFPHLDDYQNFLVQIEGPKSNTTYALKAMSDL